MTGGSLTRLLQTEQSNFLVAMTFSTKKFASFPDLSCFLFFGVLTECKLKNQKQGRPGKEAKIVTLGDRISRKY